MCGTTNPAIEETEMPITYPETVTTADGTIWTWSDDWGGYRAPGQMTHGIATLEKDFGGIVEADGEARAPRAIELPQSAIDAVLGLGTAFTPTAELDAHGAFVSFATPEGERLPFTVSAEWSMGTAGIPKVTIRCALGASVEVEVVD